jgi:hypothetical protein
MVGGGHVVERYALAPFGANSWSFSVRIGPQIDHCITAPRAALYIKMTVMLYATRPRARAKPQPGRGPTIQTFHFKYILEHTYNKE